MAASNYSDGPKWPSTLQTYLGMVLYNGNPTQRRYPSKAAKLQEKFSTRQIANRAEVWSRDQRLNELFTACLLERHLPTFSWNHDPADLARLQFNIAACWNYKVSIDTMKTSTACFQRLDLEQVAAVVLSAILNDESIENKRHVVSSLIKTIEPNVLLKSAMWLEWLQLDPAPTDQTCKFRHLVDLTSRMTTSRKVDIGKAAEWSDLLPSLLRIRRSRPAEHTHCLLLPEWMFDAAYVPVPDYCRMWDGDGMVKPGHQPKLNPQENSIVLPRKAFRALQRRIIRHFKFWVPSIRLRKAIWDLEQDVLYSVDHFKRQIVPSKDTLTVTSHFVAVQRRLQRKVVSDIHWTEFLTKGESQTFVQNAAHVPTAFERCLKALLSTEKGSSQVLPVNERLLPQIDECCLLMEAYVQIYGHGDKTNLIFKKGVYGGLSRGPVDDYNLLCDILVRLKAAAWQKGIQELPGPVRKFLAKDIMAWNQSFGDDAFAPGFVPGWETWLAHRKQNGLLLGEWEYRE